jgi:dipeptidyl aminopeptidase/acylaminoacyl peptidase
MTLAAVFVLPGFVCSLVTAHFCAMKLPKRRELTVCALCLLFGASCPSRAVCGGTGPGFDPSPVDIPTVRQGAVRSATSMDFLTIRDLHGVSISPDGKYVAFVVGQAVHVSNSYRTGLFLVGTGPDAPLIGLGSAGPPHWADYGAWVNEPPTWSPDSQYVCLRVKTRGVWQVWSWDLKSRIPSQLTHAKDNVESFGWLSDGTKIVFTVVKGDAPEAAQMASEHGILYDGTLQVGDPTPVVDRFLRQRPRERQIWTYDVMTRQEHQASEQEIQLSHARVGDLEETAFSQAELGEHRIYDVKVSPDRQRIAYKEFFSNPEHFATYKIVLLSRHLRGGTSIQLSPGAPDMSQFWWSPDSTKIYYTENDMNGRSSRLMVVAAVGGIPRPVYRGSEWLEAYSETQAGRYVACTRQTGTTPPQVALLDLTTGAIRVLIDVNPEFKNLDLSAPTRIEGTNKYGEHWFVHLVKPHAYDPGRRYPLIITTYRSGDARFLRGASGDEYPIQVFSALGFAVLSFDTGADSSFTPGDFHGALLQWASPVASMEMAVEALSEKGIVDPKRVAITGQSHGAEIVEYAVSHASFIHAAIESDSAARDPYFYYISGRAWQSRFADWGLGGWPEGKSRANWQVLSPVLNADHVTASLLSNAPDSEYVWGLPFIASLQQLGKPAELFIYPNEWHTKNQPKHRYEIYERNLDWLRFWLKDEEDPDRAKAEQYDRWRILRRLTDGGPHHQETRPPRIN